MTGNKLTTTDTIGQTTSPYISIDEAAKYLRLNKRSIRRYIHAGILPAKRLPTGVGKYLLTKEDLENFLEVKNVQNT